MLEAVPTITLSNGLQIKLKEIPTAPLISSWIWYRVGSRDELPGVHGISHWVEHMQFKGTEQFPAEVVEKGISRAGGRKARRALRSILDRLKWARIVVRRRSTKR